jgi:tyrosinase-like protein
MGCRKNYRYLSSAEKNRFVQALYQAKASGVIEQFRGDHDMSQHMAHGTSHFLPWHREFLHRFEDELRRFDPDISIPYWNSTVDTSPTDSLWADDFMGQFNAAWGLGRTCDGDLPTPDRLQRVLRRPTYDIFWRRLEEHIHNPPHMWVGGVMADITQSPSDPVFYLHHCWIDMLWAHWQLMHPGAEFTASGQGFGVNDHMMPFHVPPADVLDSTQFNVYDFPRFDTIWTDSWTNGWTTFMPFMLNGVQHYLAYKQGSGEVDIDRIKADAQGVETIWGADWSSGWSTFMPFELGGVPHYLAYKSGNGDVDIDRIRLDGQGVDTIWEDNWTSGWSSFVPFLLNGHPHYLAYKVGSGRVAIDRIRNDGRGVDTIWEDNWTGGWTSFMPFVLNGTPHYLAYKVSTGDVDIDRIRADGLGVDTIWEDTWTTGWTSFVPFQRHGQTHYLAYKCNTGRVVVDRIKADGLGVETMWEGMWSIDWTSFVPFQLLQRNHHLAYKYATGEVDIDTIHLTCSGTRSWLLALMEKGFLVRERLPMAAR